ncbi:hypothetical protein CCP3SC1_820011 [Gammaproteobacteria bacterium]
MLLSAKNFPTGSENEQQALQTKLETILRNEVGSDLFATLGTWRRILSDNQQRAKWDEISDQLTTLFKCGKSIPLDGPMIGVTMSLRDTDYLYDVAALFENNRSALAHLEIMATAWNATFGPTGLWMGKTFEPIDVGAYNEICDHYPPAVAAFDPSTARIGRNFFREPTHPDFLQKLGVPVLTDFWKLLDRPTSTTVDGFKGELLASNLRKEEAIPYTKTGGYFLSALGSSVVPEMNGKAVYQLNYRWPTLSPTFPMTRLVDEIVQIGEGVYLGQLVMASRHYSLGTINISLFGENITDIEFGTPYRPGHSSIFEDIKNGIMNIVTGRDTDSGPDYGYQSNGFFLMVDTHLATQAYGDDAFPFLRPRPGEIGFRELGYNSRIDAAVTNWSEDWHKDEELRRKFTTFTLEPSTNPNDGDVTKYRQEGESILQMLARLQKESSAASSHDDRIVHLEKFHQLFRAGIAPRIVDGRFQGQGRGYNTRFDAPEPVEWYGQPEPTKNFDYYHGATLNLHFGMADTLLQHSSTPSSFSFNHVANLLDEDKRGPNVLNEVWAHIGRFIFPWAGKSF